MKYFTLDELTFSSTAARKNINNDPPDLAIQSNLKRLVALVLDPLREEIGVPLLVSIGLSVRGIEYADWRCQAKPAHAGTGRRCNICTA